jgi:hypothetical protein
MENATTKAKNDTKFCVNNGSGAVCTAVPPPTCTPPTTLYCDQQGTCACVQLGPPPRACEVSIVYPDGRPDLAQITSSSEYCDGAGVELALAMALARILAGRGN